MSSLSEGFRDALGLAPRGPLAAAGDWDGWPWGEGPLDLEDDDGVGFHVSSSLAGALAATSVSEARAYELDVAIRICVNFLATNIAHTKLKTYDRGENAAVEIPDSRIARVLDNPNPRTSGFDLILGLVSDLALYDSAYWLKVFAGEGRDRLFRLPPTYVEPVGGDIFRGPERYELRRPNGGSVAERFPPERIVHFRWYSPNDTRLGVSRLRALRSVLDEERQASFHRFWYWRNAGRFEGVLERPENAAPWTDDRRKRFREDWASRYAGGRNAGIPQVAEDGMKYVQAGFSPRDSEFIAGREWALNIAATTFGIPLAMLSRNDSQAYASMREFHKVLYVDVLGPWNAFIERTIGVQMIPDLAETGNEYVEFNIDEKMQGDFEEQANAARSSVQVPWMSVDDMRKKRGEPPLGPPFDRPARPSAYLYGDEEPEEVSEEENVVRLEEASRAVADRP